MDWEYIVNMERNDFKRFICESCNYVKENDQKVF